VQAPTLVIWGSRDRFLEKGLAEASLALCKAGDIRWIESATHWVHHEEPEIVNEALVDFLKV
jgi:pimeloyl-ACP methyl ester carboxylesterase